MKNISGASGLRRSMDVGSPSHRETKWLRDRLEDAVTHRLGPDTTFRRAPRRRRSAGAQSRFAE